MRWISPGKLIWLGVYATAMLLLTWALLWARSEALEKLDTDRAQLAWQDWRAAANELSNQPGPVRRRAPQSQEPPGLVLLRDHFVTSWLILAVLTSLVLATIVWMVRGVVLGPKFQPQVEDEA